ncbi:MAG: hypothetical protein UV02_C0006G0012 [Candidatus Kuenenbacteria bacterium GW2011_GWA2_42_15]|uniref:Uncharacterized protein n=1 Tax=Candidatus Kuenenbacteria bacterium GW2011_GWA2_42_15 TaxID=1618677 RepID=A0A0G1BZI8_9BACT|nr:MAG: hypothetical protein UV02_C0006G0012 [Candidatus Kuenenbacteria bacterium GW2011_GWA2_42_15]
MTNIKSSCYCWIVLSVIIFGTVAFMLNLYQKTLTEISANSTFPDNNPGHRLFKNTYYEE